MKRKNKKIVNLVAICAFCAILLSVSTYAWFIGMKTVSVNKFDVEIATTEGLFLSMDGKNWKYQLDARNEEAYVNNANQWLEKPGEGLIPMSSVGDMDSSKSRMKLFQKGSLTALTKGGGYRLMTKQVENNKIQNEGNIEYIEAPGYVAFDLFVMNLSGDAYYPNLEPLNEEAIYLTTNSQVTIGSSGVDNTGIENSIRVGVVQLGRVNAELDLNDRSKDGTTSQPIITGITCASSVTSDLLTDEDEKYVTGICRDASIWEPNDTKHTENAKKWFDKSCLTRSGSDVESEASYGAACTPLNTGNAYKTYAISKDLDYSEDINVYDGLNGYATNSKTYAKYLEDGKVGKLVEMDYFTDTMKNKLGTERLPFMTLAPNSITKLRVYIWLEGQDVDNYDFAQLGKQIKVNFGFTKERFETSDIPGYDGPATNIESVMYKPTGAVKISQESTTAGVTFDSNLNIFTLPNSVKEFTFNDGQTLKTATYNSDTKVWDIK